MDVDELKSRMEALDALHELESRLKKVREENERLKSQFTDCLVALKSIAGNSCCGDCQEAKRVAKKALKIALEKGK